ncbi:MAG: glycogen/starch synthase [Actinomycetota bacterium]|nr:glycogen/starch synthase [Actinomycetota bacterium]
MHNLAFQGIYSRQVLDMIGVGQQYFSMDSLEFYGSVNFMKGGIVFSDKITTVSPTYSREILTPRYGEKLEGILKFRKKDLTGIINGIDYSLWDPENDNSLCTNYGRDDLGGKGQCKKHLLNNYFNHGSSLAPLAGSGIQAFCPERYGPDRPVPGQDYRNGVFYGGAGDRRS